jgi:hypothetical protein
MLSGSEKETLDWINELPRLPIQVWTVRTPRQAETARLLAINTWLILFSVIAEEQGRVRA